MKKWVGIWGIIFGFGLLALAVDGLEVWKYVSESLKANTFDQSIYIGMSARAFAKVMLYTLGITIMHWRFQSTIRRNALRDLEEKLSAVILELFPEGNPNVRANVFTKKARKRLKILCSVNMDGDPDKEMELKIGQGCTGVAFENAEKSPAGFRWTPVIAKELDDSTNYGRWGMSPSQIEKTSLVRWIISTPVLRSSDAKVIGVYCIDGLEKAPDDFFEDKDLPQICANWSIVFAKLLEDYGLV